MAELNVSSFKICILTRDTETLTLTPQSCYEDKSEMRGVSPPRRKKVGSQYHLALAAEMWTGS